VSEFFAYRNGELHAEAVPVARIAAEIGTPVYIYSAAAFAARYRCFAAAFLPEQPMICYAVKANSNLAVIDLLGRLGAGADVVSEGELRRALAAGIPPQRIIFSGIGKTATEMAAALGRRIHQINVESVPELRRLSAVASSLGLTAPVALRINPDVDASTHAKIATGKKENKFGIGLDEAVAAYRLAAALPGVSPVGVAVHIGSQLTDLEPYRRAFGRLAGLVGDLREAGLKVERADLGGGIGIRYRDEEPPELTKYAALVHEIFGSLDLALTFEPGRLLAGEAGVLASRVLYVNERAGRRFVIVDAAMNDLIRPTLYDAWHDVLPVHRPAADAPLVTADIVGPVCESGDTFAVGRRLAPVAEDDLVVFAEAGAYGAVMSSTYNSRLLVPEVLVAGERYAVIRARPSYDDMLSLDTVPAWLSELSEEPARKRGAA
jgi:diaminopimelate decarboxylase